MRRILVGTVIWAAVLSCDGEKLVAGPAGDISIDAAAGSSSVDGAPSHQDAALPTGDAEGAADATILDASVLDASVLDGDIADSVDLIGEPLAYLDDAVCPPGTVVDVAGTSVCLDLSNTSRLPGPCSGNTVVVAAPDDNSIFDYKFCEYGFADEQILGRHCVQQWRSAADSLAGNCEPDGGTIGPECERDTLTYWGDTTTFTYTGQGELSQVRYSASGDMWSEHWTLQFPGNNFNKCSDYGYPDDPSCQTAVLSQRAAQARIEYSQDWLALPTFDPLRSEGQDACSTIGSAGAGEITQRCGRNVYQFEYFDTGELMAYRVGQIAGPDAGVAGADFSSYLYDRGGNLRYRHAGDDVDVTVLTEYRYDCWESLRCGQEPDQENLVENGDFETVGTTGFATSWRPSVEGAISVDHAEAACGEVSIRIAMSDDQAYSIYQVVDLPSYVVRVMGYYMVDETQGIDEIYFDVNTRGLPPPRSVNEWKPFNVSMYASDQDMPFAVTLGALGRSGGPTSTLWFDRVRVEAGRSQVY